MPCSPVEVRRRFGRLLVTSWSLLVRHNFYSESGGSTFLRNVDELSDYGISHSWRVVTPPKPPIQDNWKYIGIVWKAFWWLSRYTLSEITAAYGCFRNGALAVEGRGMFHTAELRISPHACRRKLFFWAPNGFSSPCSLILYSVEGYSDTNLPRVRVSATSN
jgi:hypothetical protein